jgi:hypothetical protein
MAKKGRAGKASADDARATIAAALSPPAGRPSSLLDTRVIYCGDCLEQLKKLPDGCIDLIYIERTPRRYMAVETSPPFNSNRNYILDCFIFLSVSPLPSLVLRSHSWRRPRTFPSRFA